MDKQHRILIIEDDAFYREFLLRTLDRDYRTDVAEDGLQAITKLDLHTYDLLLCDLRMPGMSGKELIQRIREITDEDTVMIIITGFEQDWSPVDATDAKVFSYLKKGQFGPKELRKVVKNGLALRKERHKKRRFTEHLRNSNQELENKVEEGSKALLESEEKYRNLFEQSLVGIYIQQDNRIRLANRKLCEILESPLNKLLKRSIEDFVDPVEPRDVPRNRKKSKAKTHAMQEIQLKTRKGELRNAMHCSGIVRYQGAEAIQGCMLDITEWKILEQQFLQNQKMESLGTLISGITHEFNNILGAILPQTEMLVLQGKKIPSIQRPAEILLTMAEKASKLTRQLLNMSRKASLEKKSVDVNNWLRESLSFLGTTLGSNIQVELDFDPGVGQIETDPHHLDQILMNLVLNARDAMPGGGTIRISSSLCSTQAPGNKPFANRERSFVEFTVEDSGCGIPSRNLSKIFDPFFTTKETGKGTGLGLSVVYNLVKQNGGEIFAASKPGRGSTFRILFPRFPFAEQEPGIQMLPFRKILVADKNPGNRNLFQDILSKMRYEVIPAQDDREAVEIYSNQKDNIDWVILDSPFEDTAQRSSMTQLLDLNPKIKMILTHANARESLDALGDTARERGARIQCLTIPETPEILSQSLKEVLQQESP